MTTEAKQNKVRLALPALPGMFALEVDVLPQVTLPWAYKLSGEGGSMGTSGSEVAAIAARIEKALAEIRAGKPFPTLPCDNYGTCSWALEGDTVVMRNYLSRSGSALIVSPPNYIIRVPAVGIADILAEAAALVRGLIPAAVVKSKPVSKVFEPAGPSGCTVHVDVEDNLDGVADWSLTFQWALPGERSVKFDFLHPGEFSIESWRGLAAGTRGAKLHDGRGDSSIEVDRGAIKFFADGDAVTLEVSVPLNGVAPQLARALDYVTEVGLPITAPCSRK